MGRRGGSQPAWLRSEWQRAGMTINLKKACKQFGLREEDFEGVEKRHRVMMGNPYVQVKLSDCQAIVAARRAEAQAQAAQLSADLQASRTAAFENNAVAAAPATAKPKQTKKKKRARSAKAASSDYSHSSADESDESDVSSYSADDSPPKRRKTKKDQQAVTPPPGRTPKEVRSLHAGTIPVSCQRTCILSRSSRSHSRFA